MRYFLIGAAGYPLLELAWRGRTHPSMALAGGLSAALIHQAERLPMGLMGRSICCGVGITLVEAGCGLIWNRKHQVWDYRRAPLNWRGQVCLPYTAIWCGLSAAFMTLDKVCRKA